MVSTCFCILLAYEGWKFFESIFGINEIVFLMTVLSMQASLWITMHFCTLNESIDPLFKSSMILFFEFLSAIVIVVYLVWREKNIRSPQRVENLIKFQLFRFIYLMIFLFFYVKLFLMLLYIRVRNNITPFKCIINFLNCRIIRRSLNNLICFTNK